MGTTPANNSITPQKTSLALNHTRSVNEISQICQQLRSCHELLSWSADTSEKRQFDVTLSNECKFDARYLKGTGQLQFADYFAQLQSRLDNFNLNSRTATSSAASSAAVAPSAAFFKLAESPKDANTNQQHNNISSLSTPAVF